MVPQIPTATMVDDACSADLDDDPDVCDVVTAAGHDRAGRQNGQRSQMGEVGLYYYNARWYDPALGRFAQADTLVPQPGNPMDWDRYAYVRNNPVAYLDPSGHWIDTALDVAFIAYDVYDIVNNGLTWESGLALAGDVVGAALPAVTGVGVAIRIGAHADDVAKAVVIGGKVTDATGIINHAVDAAHTGEVGLSAFSRASEYGIKTYNELRALIKRSGLEAHHLIESRLAKRLGIDIKSIPCVALTKEEHRVFTREWRRYIGYVGDSKELITSNASRESVWTAAQKVYKDFPELLKAVEQLLIQ